MDIFMVLVAWGFELEVEGIRYQPAVVNGWN